MRCCSDWLLRKGAWPCSLILKLVYLLVLCGGKGRTAGHLSETGGPAYFTFWHHAVTGLGVWLYRQVVYSAPPITLIYHSEVLYDHWNQENLVSCEMGPLNLSCSPKLRLGLCICGNEIISSQLPLCMPCRSNFRHHSVPFIYWKTG